MTDTDAQRILGWVDSALDVFHQNEGQLNVSEIRIRSMLAVVRNELASSIERRAREPKRSE